MIRRQQDLRLRLSTVLRCGAAVLIASCWLIAREPNPARARESQAQSQMQLPEGEGKGIVAQKCVKCHTLDKVTKEHHTQAEWRDLLKIMAVQGLDLTTEEQDTVFGYLAANFGKVQASSKVQAATAESAETAITYSKNVAPILYKNCAV